MCWESFNFEIIQELLTYVISITDANQLNLTIEYDPNTKTTFWRILSGRVYAQVHKFINTYAAA